MNLNFEQPSSSIARRRKVVLLLHDVEDQVSSKALSKLSSDVGATLICTSDAAEFTSYLAQEGSAIRLVVVDSRQSGFISFARQALSQSQHAELIVLAESSGSAELKRSLGLAPRLGDHWSIQSPDTPYFEKSIRLAYLRADQRRSTRTTLDRFNARLATPAADIDASELRALTISERFLSSVLDSAFDAVILVDMSGRVSSFNRSAEALFERTAAATISEQIADLSVGDWPETISTALRSASTGAVFHSDLHVNGDIKTVEILGSPVFDSHETQIATSFILRDITSRLQAEIALRTNEKLAAVGRLASSIAHEINNPLESITNILYIARQSTRDPDLCGWLDLADQELRRVSAIANQTLRFHKQSTAPTAVDTMEMLEGVLSIFQSKITNHHVTVIKDFRANLPLVCLEGEIRQVLTNLISNSLDAMPGGGTLTLRTRESAPRGCDRTGIVFLVSDSGSGMTDVTIKRLFDAFYSTKGNNGTGLGLWISQEIVARHAGTLWVRSSQGQKRPGTTFRLFLPSV